MRLGVICFAGASLNGGCPLLRNYDGLMPTTGSATHRYATGTTMSPYAAIVMNKSASGRWNTVLESFGWFDIRDPFGGAPGRAERELASKILSCVVPTNCVQQESPTGGPDPQTDAPRVSALYQNVPNPFNPVTEIRFDLARDGPVTLRVYDVAGKQVRVLMDAKMAAGRDRRVAWNGLDDQGRRVASGVYFYRLAAGDFSATRKMLLLE